MDVVVAVVHAHVRGGGDQKVYGHERAYVRSNFVGAAVGASVGAAVGASVGESDGAPGTTVGASVGVAVGAAVGAALHLIAADA